MPGGNQSIKTREGNATRNFEISNAKKNEKMLQVQCRQCAMCKSFRTTLAYAMELEMSFVCFFSTISKKGCFIIKKTQSWKKNLKIPS